VKAEVTRQAVALKAISKSRPASAAQKILRSYDTACSTHQTETTPLCLAAWLGFSDVVEGLLQQGAELETPTPEGFTPLCLAGLQGHLPVAERLILAGANPQHTTPSGSTPLCLAVRKGHTNLVKILIHAGADVNHADAQGMSPLCLAVMHGHLEMVQLLLSLGATVDTHAGPSGERSEDLRSHPLDSTPGFATMPRRSEESAQLPSATALCLAAWKGNKKVASVLLQAGADPNSRCSGGQSALYIACKDGRQEVVECLLRAGATPDLLTLDGQSPLGAALQGNHRAVCLELLKHGADCAHLSDLPSSLLITLNQWQAEVSKTLREEQDQLVFGIGHMLAVARGM